MMSRCFPFPPPGYEVRPRSEHKDLLKKEKRKKKHRKDEHREKRERKEKDRDHRKDKHNKKHKREKRREKRKDRDRDKAKNLPLEQGSQKNYDLGNRKPEERVQNEAVKDIKPTDELVTRNFGHQDHANHKCSNTRELLPQRADSIGATGSKEKERNLLSRMVKKSAQATQDNRGLVQKSGSIPRANKKGMRRGVDSKTRMKNGKNLQVGSAEKHSSRRHSCNGVDLLQDNSDTERTSEGVHTTSTVVSIAGRGANGSIAPSPNTLQMAEEMGQHPVISVHSANGRSDRIGTKGMTGKENQSANNRGGKMDQHFVQSKDGAVEGKENTKEMKTNDRNGVKGKDRDLGVKKRKKRKIYRKKWRKMVM